MLNKDSSRPQANSYVKLELLRLRAMLLPEEEASEEEKKEIEAARKEIAKGSKVDLDEFAKDLC